MVVPRLWRVLSWTQKKTNLPLINLFLLKIQNLWVNISLFVWQWGITFVPMHDCRRPKKSSICDSLVRTSHCQSEWDWCHLSLSPTYQPAAHFDFYQRDRERRKGRGRGKTGSRLRLSIKSMWERRLCQWTCWRSQKGSTQALGVYLVIWTDGMHTLHFGWFKNKGGWKERKKPLVS